MPKTISPTCSGATNQKERRDCVVRAITNVSGKSYDEVHRILKNNGRKDCKGTPFNVCMNTFTELGYEGIFFGKSLAAYWYGKSKGHEYHPANKNLQAVMKDLPRGKFVVFVRGHATALVHGELIDTFPNKANSRVIAIFYKPDSVWN